MRFAVVIIHLAVYEVISLSFDFHATCRFMVQDAANPVTHVPVCDEVTICKIARSESETITG